MTPVRVLLVALLACAASASCSRDEPPAILLVTVDTLRADRLGSYGYPHDTTPHMDALAKESILFERSYSHAPFTAPSHASLLTSLHPQSHGVLWWGQKMAPSAPTMQEIFKARDYRAGAFHNHPGLIPSDITRGFDRVDVRYMEPWQPTVSAFLDWVDEAPKKPFVAWVHLWDAHRPYGFRDWRPDWVRPHVDRSGDDLVLAYAERGFREPRDPRIGRHEGFYNVRPDQRAAPIDVGGEPRVLEPADWEYIADRYDASVRYADQGVGALVDGLRRRKLLDRTIVVVTSDHGETLMERESSWFTHDPFLYEEALRVPLIVRLPGARHGGARVPHLARGIDVLPTLLELADVAPPTRVPLQGRSLMPLLADGPKEPRYLFAGTQGRSAKESARRLAPDDPSWLEYRQTLTDGRYKVIHDLELDRWYAFDLVADPGETRDLVEAREVGDAVLALRDKLRAHREALPVADRLDVPQTKEQRDALAGLGYVGADDEDPPQPPPPPVDEPTVGGTR